MEVGHGDLGKKLWTELNTALACSFSILNFVGHERMLDLRASREIPPHSDRGKSQAAAPWLAAETE